jgi:hypothetical protein
MNLAALKKKLADRAPFLTFDFAGEDGVLLQEQGDAKIPLTVQCIPPTLSWVLETGMITTLILRYSKSYQETIEASGHKLKAGDLQNKPELADKILKEVGEKILASDEEKIQQVSTIVQLGKEYLTRRAEYGWYGDREEKFRLRFTMSKDDADLLNDQSDDSLYIWVDNISDMELVAVASQLVGAIDTENFQVANIPLKGTTITEEGKVEEGVIGSVPADKVANFPRNTRNIVVEDV